MKPDKNMELLKTGSLRDRVTGDQGVDGMIGTAKMSAFEKALREVNREQWQVIAHILPGILVDMALISRDMTEAIGLVKEALKIIQGGEI